MTNKNNQLLTQVKSVAGQRQEVDELNERIKLLENTTDSNCLTIANLKEELTTANVRSDRAEERLEELRGHAKQTAESEREKAIALENAETELASLRQNVDSSVAFRTNSTKARKLPINSFC